MKRMQRGVSTRGFCLSLCNLVISMVLLGGASGAGAPGRVSDPHDADHQPLVQQQTAQGVQLALEVDRQSIGIADRLRMSLVIDAPVAMQVSLPKAEKALGPFTVARQTPFGPTAVTPKRRQWKQEYILEPTRAGTLTLPALTVDVETAKSTSTSGPSIKSKHVTLRTQPVAINVTTMLPPDADVTAPQDIAPPTTLMRRGWPRWLWLGGLALVGCGLVAAFLYRRRQRRVAQHLQPQPAHQLALAALQRLQEQNLIGAHRIDVFYIQISAIVRRYIEWRFGLRAPEQTTEEFLAVVLSGGLLAMHRDLLDRFLQHCDLVKFARHEPTPEDMQRTFDSAWTFVEQTADDDVLAPVGTAGVEA